MKLNQRNIHFYKFELTISFREPIALNHCNELFRFHNGFVVFCSRNHTLFHNTIVISRTAGRPRLTNYRVRDKLQPRRSLNRTYLSKTLETCF